LDTVAYSPLDIPGAAEGNKPLFLTFAGIAHDNEMRMHQQATELTFYYIYRELFKEIPANCHISALFEGKNATKHGGRR
jgi:hypothetical protein